MKIVSRLVEISKKSYTAKQKLIRFLPAGTFFLLIIPSFMVFACPKVDQILPFPLMKKVQAAFILVLLGVGVTLWSVYTQLTLGKGTPFPLAPTQKLVTTGPYAFCRNPITLGVTVYYTGVALMIGSSSALALTLLFLLFSIVYIKLIEEKELEMRFGKEYKEYKRKTPFLIPLLI